jgi:hypothetical protein
VVQAGSGPFWLGSACFRLGPGFFVPVFVHFSLLVACVLVFLDFPLLVGILCGSFYSA